VRWEAWSGIFRRVHVTFIPPWVDRLITVLGEKGGRKFKFFQSNWHIPSKPSPDRGECTTKARSHQVADPTWVAVGYGLSPSNGVCNLAAPSYEGVTVCWRRADDNRTDHFSVLCPHPSAGPGSGGCSRTAYSRAIRELNTARAGCESQHARLCAALGDQKERCLCDGRRWRVSTNRRPGLPASQARVILCFCRTPTSSDLAACCDKERALEWL